MNVLFKNNKLALILFMAPLVIIFSMVIILPLFQAGIMSFTEWDGVNKPSFAGFNNYKAIFKSPDFSVSIRNSIIYSLVLTLYQISLATIFAAILTRGNIRGSGFFKNVFFLPVVLSVSVVAQLWLAIYHGDFGLINQLAESLGWEWSQNWLIEPVKNIIAIVMAEAWKGMGYHMLIIYAAMHNVSEHYYEAAHIDGASSYRQFIHITLPLIRHALTVSFIMCITYGFRAFEQIFIMTTGGPGNYSYTLPIMMYYGMFRLRKYGYASAIAVLIVIICLGLMLLIDKLTQEKD